MSNQIISAAELLPGHVGCIEALRQEGVLRQRLLDLGIIPGAKLLRTYTAPSGSPIAFEIQGMVVALRKRDAAKIMVREVTEPWSL